MPEEHSAGAVIFRREKQGVKFLLMQYPAGEIEGTVYKGHWGLVKGLTTDVAEDQTVKQTVVREIEEETGIKKREIKFIKGFHETIDFYYKRGAKTMHKTVEYFLVETKKEEIRLSEEHQGYAWLSFDKVMKKIVFKNLKEVLEKANKAIKKIKK